jgi:hypothetical protein
MVAIVRPRLRQRSRLNGKGWDLVPYPNAKSRLRWGITPTATRGTGNGGALLAREDGTPDWVPSDYRAAEVRLLHEVAAEHVRLHCG